MNLESLDFLLNSAKSSGATAADAVMVETLDVSISRRLGQKEGLERSENQGIGLRVFVGGSQAMVSTTDLSKKSLGELAAQAVSMAKVSPADPDSKLAPENLYATTFPALDLCDEIEPEVEWLDQECAIMEEAARAVPGVTNSEGATASYGRQAIGIAILQHGKVAFANSYRSSHFSHSISVLAGTDTEMERDYDYSSVRHRSDLTSAQVLGISAGERAVRRLNPKKIATCQLPIIFDPRVSKSLLSIFASAINGSSIARGGSFLAGDMGKQVFAKNISIIDDPHRVRGLASKPFDAEGVTNKKMALVEGGEINHWLLDMRTATKLNMPTTGHASRGLASPPSPASTNLYMKAGDITPGVMIKDIKQGLYITENFGGGVNLVTGDFSQGASGFYIENGELTYPVSGITVAGHLRDMFARLIPANDLQFRYSTNAPTMLIDGMTIAGT